MADVLFLRLLNDLIFRQSTFGRSHHTVRNISRLDDHKGGQDLSHFVACRQLYASV